MSTVAFHHYYDDLLGDEVPAHAVRSGLKSIANAHGMSRQPVTRRALRVSLGSWPDQLLYGRFVFYPRWLPLPDRIEVRRGPHPWPDSTAVHEAGHFFDTRVLVRRGEPASVRAALGTGPLVSWWKTTVNTEAYLKLRALHAATKHPETLEHLNYALLPEELFARGYCQWVTAKCPLGHALRVQLDDQRALQYPYQWSDPDFAGIAAEFDSILSHF